MSEEYKTARLREERDVLFRGWIAAVALIEIVEGVGCEDWRDANGRRIKDTEQWVRFYNAARKQTK